MDNKIYMKGPGSLPPLFNSGPAKGKYSPSKRLKARSISLVAQVFT